MQRPLNKSETLTVCLTCGALIAEQKAHKTTHEVKHTYHNSLKVSELIEQLRMFPSDSRIGIDASGWEVEEVTLSIHVEGAPDITLLKS